MPPALRRLHQSLKQQLGRPSGELRATVGVRLLDGALQHREQDRHVVELQVLANDTGSPGRLERPGQLLQGTLAQEAEKVLALGSTAQNSQQPGGTRLLEHDLVNQLQERPRIIGSDRRLVGEMLQALFVYRHRQQAAFGEVPIQRRLAYTGALRDTIQGHVGSLDGQELDEGPEDRLAVALGIAPSARGCLFQTPGTSFWRCKCGLHST